MMADGVASGGATSFHYVPELLDAKERLVFLWESPVLWGGEGGWVACNDCGVEWLEADGLVDELTETLLYLRGPAAAPAATGPASEPASATASAPAAASRPA